MTNPSKEIFEILAPRRASMKVIHDIGTNRCILNQISGPFEKWAADIRLIDGIYYCSETDDGSVGSPIGMPLEKFLLGYCTIIGAL
jgi:hypothetical protein